MKFLKGGGLVANQHAKVTGEFGSMLMIDGQRGYGQVIGHEAMLLGIARRRSWCRSILSTRCCGRWWHRLAGLMRALRPIAGNCHNGGHPAELYKTFSEQLAKLSPSTLIYPGHDYLENNLRFTLNREPDNKSARELLDKLAGQDPNAAYISTLEVEGRINTFFRLTGPTVVAKLREAFRDFPEKPDQCTVFLRLRELRNTW